MRTEKEVAPEVELKDYSTSEDDQGKMKVKVKMMRETVDISMMIFLTTTSEE